MPYLPPFIAPARFTDADAALARAREIYDNSIAHLRSAMQRFVAGESLPGHARACYPFVRVQTDTVARLSTQDSSHLSYGFVAGPGRFETTLTRPDLYAGYYLEQFTLLLQNHGAELEVGTSSQPIPVHFSFAENDHIDWVPVTVIAILEEGALRHRCGRDRIRKPQHDVGAKRLLSPLNEVRVFDYEWARNAPPHRLLRVQRNAF